MRSLLAVLSLFLASSAYAADIGYQAGALVGVGFNSGSISDISGTPTTMARGGVVAGAAVTRWFSPYWGLELDGIYAFRKFNLYVNGQGPQKNSYSALEFPLLARVNFFDGISVGVGPYLAQVVSSLPQFTNRGTEVGLAGSLHFNSPQIPEFASLRFFVDVRYLLGLTNQANVGGGVYRERQTEAVGGALWDF